MDAGTRIQQAFHSSPAELSRFLRIAGTNARTTLAMMFQNPFILDVQDAAEESIALLLNEAGGHAQDAGLDESQRATWLGVFDEAATDFRNALTSVLSNGLPTSDRAAVVKGIAHLLRLPIE